MAATLIWIRNPKCRTNRRTTKRSLSDIMPIIEIENLTKDYDVGFWRKRKVRALEDISLSIESGEIFGLLGANAAGKTTTLKLLMRLLYPTEGDARILGHDISDVAMHHRIGY